MINIEFYCGTFKDHDAKNKNEPSQCQKDKNSQSLKEIKFHIYKTGERCTYFKMKLN